MRTYKTLAELRDAYASGRIIAPLTICHSCPCEVFTPGDSDPDEGDTVFGMDACQLLEQALDLLGIPHEHD